MKSRKAARKPNIARRAAKPNRTPSPKTKTARRAARARATVRPKTAKPAAKPARLARVPATHPAALDRERRRLPEEERVSTAIEADARALAAAKTGHHEIVAAIERHHETSPAMTAGDVDANWEGAYANGDEAPGGDNPTPDQDRVDDIGHALGVTYDDAEELRPNDKIADRDAHRWELDPASSDDWPHDDNEKD